MIKFIFPIEVSQDIERQRMGWYGICLTGIR